MLKKLLLIFLLLSSFGMKEGQLEIDHKFNKVEQVAEQDSVKLYTENTYKVSHYGHGDNFHGKLMANGEKMNKYNFTVASPLIKGTNKPKYALGTKLLLVNPKNGKSVEVVVTDTGSFGKKGRELDLSYSAFLALGNPAKGIILVEIKIIKNNI